eukprot:Nitzschia sp. Nitz4//scaffold10_size219509//6161//15193//NITZ4_001393-RA/size219509-augustus-gene-0.260-mRNA-1//-1//CDS//3329532815//4130//frame0
MGTCATSPALTTSTQHQPSLDSLTRYRCCHSHKIHTKHNRFLVGYYPYPTTRKELIMEEDFGDLIRNLASAKFDALSAEQQEESLAKATEALQTSTPDRAVLSSITDLKCVSKNGYQRTAALFCAAIGAETKDAELRTTLIQSLCDLLQKAPDADIVQECRAALYRSETLVESEVAAISQIFKDMAVGSDVGLPVLAMLPVPDWERIVENTVGSDRKISSADMGLFGPVLHDSLSSEVWEQTVGPVVVLKLKAKPETLVGMVEGLTRYLNPSTIISSSLVETDLVPVCLKHLKSPKDAVRNPAGQILVNIGELVVQGDSSSPDEASTCLARLLKPLAACTPKDMPQVPQRQALYATWKGIGSAVVSTSMQLSQEILSDVLSSLTALVSKEAKAAKEARQMGLAALMEWLMACKLQQSGDGGNGFTEALAFIRKPVSLKSGIESQFFLGNMVQRVHPDVLQLIVGDLWKDAAFQKGLEGLIEAANKKHESSSSIPQVDGLLAVYLSLLHVSSSGKSKLPPLVDKAVSGISASKDKTTFVFGDATVRAIPSNPLVALVLPQIFFLYAKMGSVKPTIKATSSGVIALANCIARPSRLGDQSPGDTMESTIRGILDVVPMADSLVEALFAEMNARSLVPQIPYIPLVASIKIEEEGDEASPKKGKPGHAGMEVGVIRRISKLLSTMGLSPNAFGKSVLLMHFGTSLRSKEKQRTALVSRITETLQEVVLSKWSSIQDILSPVATIVSITSSRMTFGDQEGGEISESMQEAAQSLIFSLGLVASSFSPGVDDPEDDEMKPYVFARRLCVEDLAPKLGKLVDETVASIKELSESDIELYCSPFGSLYKESTGKSEGTGAQGKGRRSEEEEWELQMKKELAKKKAASAPAKMSASDKKLVEQQDLQRKGIDLTLSCFMRATATVEALAQSEIEVANACLPVLSAGVLEMAVGVCPASRSIEFLQKRSTATLETLCACVYEIEETNARMLAEALKSAYRRESTSTEHPGESQCNQMKLSAFPTPCEPAATTIFEMDEYQEDLSPSSFAFLFPVVRASLMGPRTTPGCEGALRVLERHTILLAGETKDPVVMGLRLDMACSVLELLQHDRAQAFVDPTPYETLVACYQVDEDAPGAVLTTAELAPLLDERGALGPKNCRVAAMIALGSIAQEHIKVVKSNPLIENRIWMNCFESNDSIRTEARKTWGIMNGLSEDDDMSNVTGTYPPSQMYSIPLLPLLSHSDKSIASAAAAAFGNGMAAHTSSVYKSIQKLCSTFIDAVPQPGSEAKPKSSFPAPIVAAPAPKKSAGVSATLKKKTVKKSALEVAGIGQPKKSKKTSAAAAAMLKPKKERTLDQVALESQFKTGTVEAPPEKDSPEKISSRLGVLSALGSLPTAKVEMDISSVKLLSSFLMAYGIADSDPEVKTFSRDALRDVVTEYGSSEDAIGFLLPHLEKILKSGIADTSAMGDLSVSKISAAAVSVDRRKEGAVVALGAVALHLKGPENASKIDTTVDMLLASLKTPSEDVQSSVAGCLEKLMKKGNTQDRIETILEDLLKLCLEGESSAMRRGGAYGISAAVKGSGIATLKKFGIVAKLEDACSSGSATSKEGSLFAIELLCMRLGLLFEPYVIVLLPSLLRCFSDSSDHVRKAASNAGGTIMSKLSAHGVKLVMPAVLTAFNDNAWRTKQASIHVLGSMCHLAPKQLAQALPKVVPKLVEAFGDTHPAVKSSAQQALDEITTVIKNPEISALSPVLLKALTDPAKNTPVALEELILTEFVHAIDAPSLALIVPILHRGMRDRAATTKRYGALITGNICTMVNDPRDFVPYLPTLIPDLQASLLDPIPDVRSISAKAFGTLTRGLGESAFPELRPWLVERLQAEDVSSAERSGAAQGLTEVLTASGTSTVERVVVEDILPLKSHPSPATREGVLWMLTFLPLSLGQNFTPLLDGCLPALIAGLSDEVEEVRDVGMRAGRVIIKSHGRTQYNKILPILENGMTDIDHRIRLSALTLIGDLLSMIGGTTVLRTDGDTQDDIRRAEKAQAQLTLTLGIETRNRVLSEVYLARSDSESSVRHTAVQVWKTVVSVTARTLRQILPVLVTRVVADLASGDTEKTEMAGLCLGDLVSKLGDSVMPEVVPVLGDALYDGDANCRRGVCVGLSRVISSSTKDQILRYFDLIVKVVQDALCDEDESVRERASVCFQNLHVLVGSRAMDEVVPSLMVALESSESDETRRSRALNGLTGILSLRSKQLLPYIIPRLIAQPVSQNHAVALGAIAAVTGNTIYYHFRTIIPALINDLANATEDGEREAEVRNCARALFANSDEGGINWMFGEITKRCTSDKAELRRESCWMLETVIVERKDLADFYEYNSTIIRELVARLNDEDASVLKATNRAFTALSKHVPAEELVNEVEYMRNLIATLVSDARRRKGGVGDGEFLLPGFNMPKGLEPLLPIYQRGILYGTPAIREASADGLGEVIALTASKYLAGPLIIKMTGPLLRIVGDRNPANVKVSILKTLGLILVKGGPALRAFVPQFQTTFVKALSDPSRQVRVEAIKALGLLMPLSTRVDPLLKELVTGSLGSGAAEGVGAVAVQTATLEALTVVLKEGGSKAKVPTSIPSALDASKELVQHDDDSVREAAAKVFGAACDILGAEVTSEALEEVLANADGPETVQHGIGCVIRRVFTANVSVELEETLCARMLDISLGYLRGHDGPARDASCAAVGAAVGRSKDPANSLRKVESDLKVLMQGWKERLETVQSLARGFCLAIQLSGVEDPVQFLGSDLLTSCLELALAANQRVQFAFNDVLCVALDVANGQAGLDAYCKLAMFEDAKRMKSVYSKVLVKIKETTILND